jgi:hypothetical protein
VTGGERLQCKDDYIGVMRLGRYGIHTAFCKTVYVDHACLFRDMGLNHPAFKDVELIPWNKSEAGGLSNENYS